MTDTVIKAALSDPHIPLSEFIRKENFYKSFEGFSKAIQADPVLIKSEIMRKLR